MIFSGHHLEKEGFTRKQIRMARRMWIMSFVMGILTTIIALLITYTISSNSSSSLISLPLGVVISIFLGLGVFLAGTFISIE